MSRPVVYRIGASFIALAILAFASANASHIHVPATFETGPQIAHHEDDSPQPEGGSTEGHSCVSCNTAESAAALVALGRAAVAVEPTLRGVLRDVPPVVGVALYHVGPERAPPTSA